MRQFSVDTESHWNLIDWIRSRQEYEQFVVPSRIAMPPAIRLIILCLFCLLVGASLSLKGQGQDKSLPVWEPDKEQVERQR